MGIKTLSHSIAAAIKEANPEQTHSVEVMAYSLTIILNTMFIIAVSLVIGALTGNFIATLLAIISLLIIRFVSGGPHINSVWGCNIVSILICTVVPHIPMFLPLLVVNIVSLVIMLVFSPQPDKNAKMPTGLYPYLKILSVILVFFNFFIQSDVIGLIFLIQAIIIIPWRKEGRA
ncbi:accessory gene regulator ArgB-like protein [Paenibacillus sp. IITD108]|uniref:accessory gene regulator ArgB-like protein n=1 Tax=Paenibacillus sp. IITD108 TaxID=3116649 RepID=UPI002F3F9193